jgi:Predicted nucleotide-binding protein containing TIR-like domain
MTPTLFIGSSTERLPIARGLQLILTDSADVTVWDEAPEFALGESLLDGLIKVGELYDFALLVFGQDDCTMMSGEKLPTVRDNVIFELGLFMGQMGTGRAFWLSPRGSKAPHLSSDLKGIVHLEFDEPELTSPASIVTSLSDTRHKVHQQISSLGFRTNRTSHVVPMRRALCLASSQYSQARFQQDLEYIHAFFSEREVTSEQGVTADEFQSHFSPGNIWDMVHLGLFVDKENQRMLFDTASGIGDKESLPVQAIEGMVKECHAALVVIITCDSLKFGEQLARFTNVIAGHQAITPSSALSWAKVFYQALSIGTPLFQAFDKAQDAADPGLVLLARRDIRFRRVANLPNIEDKPDTSLISIL